MLLAVPGLCSAQVWRHWQFGDGLYEAFTRRLARDSQGRLLAVHGNVDKFSALDGYSIVHLPAPIVSDVGLQSGPDGSIWSAHTGGIQRFVNGAWTDIAVPDPVRARVRSMVVLTARAIVLGYPDRAALFDPVEGRYQTILTREQTAIGRFTRMSRRTQGGIWISGDRGLAAVAVDTNGEVRVLSDAVIPPPEYENFGRITDMAGGPVLAPATRKADKHAVLLRFGNGRWSEVYRSSGPHTTVKAAWLAFGKE
ncbi:MAG TPA: hypothetical protein VES20_00930, partial [Bryobacteraceae bacterium]|nr:hypothetical protein [Bryobacteraceae bacterium]